MASVWHIILSGPNLAAAFLRYGLVDEVQVCPVVLGEQGCASLPLPMYRAHGGLRQGPLYAANWLGRARMTCPEYSRKPGTENASTGGGL
jgi:riboflavin biosynthesis pyrimidine reductase